MKKIVILGLMLIASATYAQPNTDVYLLDISEENGVIAFSNLRNISNNTGYDNQPSFYDDNSILFSSTRNGQTDIAKYDIISKKIDWLTDTPNGSEYSPLRIPDSKNVSAIRLDTTGLQRLYQYNFSTGDSQLILENEKVGYHIWHSKDILVNTILVDNRMDLVTSNFKNEINYTVQKNVGRSLHKIPGTKLISYVAQKADITSVHSLNPINGETTVLYSLPENINDMCWLTDGRLLFPSGKSIIALNLNSKEKPKTLHFFQEEEINTITRMAISPNGKHLAIVSNESPAKIVQKQVDSYNASNLEAFINCYSKNVVVRNFAKDTLYIGHNKMRENYSGLSPKNINHQVEVVKRIVIGNKVIDHEKVSLNGKFQQMQVAIYEVSNGAINSMTFIFDDESSNPEVIVQKQMNAYNERDIEAFLKTYDEDVEIFNFLNEARYSGKNKMRESYSSFFDSTPDLNYSVKNRIVIANTVIDEEFITANGNKFSAVAIYQVENGKITKVTFLR